MLFQSPVTGTAAHELTLKRAYQLRLTLCSSVLTKNVFSGLRLGQQGGD